MARHPHDSGDFIDFARIAVGNGAPLLSILLPLFEGRPLQTPRHAALHRRGQGRPALPHFFDEAVAFGVITIEILDNGVPPTESERRDIIREAIAAGLSVFGRGRLEGSYDDRRQADRTGRQSPLSNLRSRRSSDAADQITSRPLVHLKLEFTTRLSFFKQFIE
jgi:hypothetical protein